MSMIPLTNFTKGEIGPELQARIDTDQYGAAARKVRNFIIQRYGGLSFRPGFRLVGEVENTDKNIRYIPFQYNMEQAYVLALEDSRMRLLAGGGMVAEAEIGITGITNDLTPLVTAPYHGYSVGDRVFFSGIVGMEEINGRQFTIVEVPDANHFRIDADTMYYGTFVSSSGTVNSAPPPAPTPDPPPPPTPPAPPQPPILVGGGGSGDSIGERRQSRFDGYERPV